MVRPSVRKNVQITFLGTCTGGSEELQKILRNIELAGNADLKNREYVSMGFLGPIPSEVAH